MKKHSSTMHAKYTVRIDIEPEDGIEDIPLRSRTLVPTRLVLVWAMNGYSRRPDVSVLGLNRLKDGSTGSSNSRAYYGGDEPNWIKKLIAEYDPKDRWAELMADAEG